MATDRRVNRSPAICAAPSSRCPPLDAGPKSGDVFVFPVEGGPETRVMDSPARRIMDAVEAYLGHPEKAVYERPKLDLEPEPVKFTEAISEDTETIKTGRYEP